MSILEHHMWSLRRFASLHRATASERDASDDAHESLDAILIAMAAAGLIGPEFDREKDLNDPPATVTEEIETWTLSLLLNEHGGVSTAPPSSLTTHTRTRTYGAWMVLRPGAMELVDDGAMSPANLERLVLSRASDLRAMNVSDVEIREPMADGGVHVTTLDLGDGKRSASDPVDRA